ncbi:MAG: TniB family NTP-binding protein [Verrucomicrobia bacterium]|nr:TniB family NTP-binding protein [Verrucomicrobiota bacterium]
MSMGCVLPIHQSVTTLRQRTRVTARQLEVRMLVIDEIHSILAGTFREQRIVSERDPVFGQRPAYSSGLRRDSRSQTSPHDRPAVGRSV